MKEVVFLFLSFPPKQLTTSPDSYEWATTTIHRRRPLAIAAAHRPPPAALAAVSPSHGPADSTRLDPSSPLSSSGVFARVRDDRASKWGKNRKWRIGEGTGSRNRRPSRRRFITLRRRPATTTIAPRRRPLWPRRRSERPPLTANRRSRPRMATPLLRTETERLILSDLRFCFCFCFTFLFICFQELSSMFYFFVFASRLA